MKNNVYLVAFLALIGAAPYLGAYTFTYSNKSGGDIRVTVPPAQTGCASLKLEIKEGAMQAIESGTCCTATIEIEGTSGAVVGYKSTHNPFAASPKCESYMLEVTAQQASGTQQKGFNVRPLM